MSSFSDEKWEFGGLTFRVSIRKLDDGWFLEAIGMEGRTLGMPNIPYRVGSKDWGDIQGAALNRIVEFLDMAKKAGEKEVK